MPLRRFLLISSVPALALSLACGGGSSTNHPAAPTPVPTPVPRKAVPSVPATLALEQSALTCAPGDPFLLLPVAGGLGEGPDAAGFVLEGRLAETGETLSLEPLAVGDPAQSVFICAKGPDRPGTSTFQVRARVGETWTAPCSIAITVQPAGPAEGLRVTPAAATVVPGGRVLFKAFRPAGVGRDDFQIACAPVGAGSGTIQVVGQAMYLYQAPQAPGTYELAMTFLPDGRQARVQVTVAQPAS